MSSTTLRATGGRINRRSAIARAAAVAAVGGAIARPASAVAHDPHDGDHDDHDRKRPPEAQEAATNANNPINQFVHLHDWGPRQGEWLLTVTHPALNRVSQVFVSASEGSIGAKVVGDARITVHNVTPFDNGVTVWVEVDSRHPVPLTIDYLVVDIGL